MSPQKIATDRLIIFDSTLRDAEQSPGATLDVEEKVEIAHQLAKLGVDVIEAGFPVSSPMQFEGVLRISREVHGPVIAALARTLKKDIDSAAEALKDASQRRIHTFTSTSPVHMEYMLRMSPAVVLAKAVEAIAYARSFTDDVEFSCQDATRSELSFLCEIVQAAIEAGATTINLPDTVGYAIPDAYAEMFRHVISRVPGAENVAFSAHCHNDLGLATANSLAGVQAGAAQVECTINGLGERAGNAALEEVVMAVKVRCAEYPRQSRVVTTEIYRTSQLVSRLMGWQIQANKAIVGANAFAHESGIHVDGMLKNRSTYEIIQPQAVGVPGSRNVLGRHSGRHGFKVRCDELGFDLSPEQVDQTYQQFLALADKKKCVYDEDIVALLEEQLGHKSETFRLEHLQYSSGSGQVPSATVRILRNEQTVQEAAWGDGPVDAAINALKKAMGVEVELEHYAIKAVTGSSQALGEATLRIRSGNAVHAGRGVSTDIVEASAKAFVSAINNMMRFENRNG